MSPLTVAHERVDCRERLFGLEFFYDLLKSRLLEIFKALCSSGWHAMLDAIAVGGQQ